MIDTLLLVALPASGKSELRRYLASLPAEVVARDFHLGHTKQLDDFPYVHLMRRIDEELRRFDVESVFFPSPDQPFKNPWDWGTLTVLLDEDYRNLRTGTAADPDPGRLTWRIDKARQAVGAVEAFGFVPARARRAVEEGIAPDVAEFVATLPDGPLGRTDTALLEFARGGPSGATPPLDSPHGYAYSLSLFDPTLLATASILYVWVTPEESRRRNLERARPGADGSILHHGVPEAVLDADYGVDDFLYLLESSEVPGTITVRRGGEVFHLPAAVFDNREDHTSFLRADPEAWPADRVAALHEELRRVFAGLANR